MDTKIGITHKIKRAAAAVASIACAGDDGNVQVEGVGNRPADIAAAADTGINRDDDNIRRREVINHKTSGFVDSSGEFSSASGTIHIHLCARCDVADDFDDVQAVIGGTFAAVYSGRPQAAAFFCHGGSACKAGVDDGDLNPLPGYACCGGAIGAKIGVPTVYAQNIERMGFKDTANR